ncbi:MAG: V-containing nitrogenase subunit delta [Zoogloea sp.]|nr:V-containing nitrogenase subunit delta [Zoogloea sp.]
MNMKVDELYGYVQERCLWQFASRTWDRTENIDGVLGMAAELLNGRTPAPATPNERCFLADARSMVSDCQGLFPWLKEAGPDEVAELMRGLKERLVEITITKSRNRELNHSLY